MVFYLEVDPNKLGNISTHDIAEKCSFSW